MRVVRQRQATANEIAIPRDFASRYIRHVKIEIRLRVRSRTASRAATGYRRQAVRPIQSSRKFIRTPTTA